MANNTPDDFIMGALVGSVIGIAAALILTPVSVESLRKKFSDRFKAFPKLTKKPFMRTRRKPITGQKIAPVVRKKVKKTASTSKRNHS